MGYRTHLNAERNVSTWGLRISSVLSIWRLANVGSYCASKVRHTGEGSSQHSHHFSDFLFTHCHSTRNTTAVALHLVPFEEKQSGTAGNRSGFERRWNVNDITFISIGLSVVALAQLLMFVFSFRCNPDRKDVRYYC